MGSTIENFETLYKSSFGLLPHKTRYVDPWQSGFDIDSKSQETGAQKKSLDLRPRLKSIMCDGMQKVIQAKAFGPQAGGAGTAGYAMSPIYVSSVITDQSRKYTPLVELFPRVTNYGPTADYNIITAKGGGFSAGPDASLTERDNTYDRASTAIKYYYSVGRILGPAQVTTPSYMIAGMTPSGSGMGEGSFSDVSAPNALQLEILTQARALKEWEEYLIVNGSTSTDANQFDGIVALQSTTNQNDLNGTALTWNDVEDTIQYAFDDSGRPKLAVASSNVVTDLRKIMIDTFNFRPSDLTQGAELPFGIPPMLALNTMCGLIPVIPSQFLSNTSGAKQIFFLDMDVWEMRILMDMTYMDLAKINDSDKFALKIYGCLICRATQYNSFIDNIL